MSANDRLDAELFKIVSRAIGESDNLEIMANHLSQLLVAALEIKGCAIFILNPATKELERIANFGLSMKFLSKGPVLADQSVGGILQGESVIIKDVFKEGKLQYPDDVKAEGIGAILSIPIVFRGEVLGDVRLYHSEVWDISDRDLDLLHLLVEDIGLAMSYTRLLNAMQAINDILKDMPGELLSK